MKRFYYGDVKEFCSELKKKRIKYLIRESSIEIQDGTISYISKTLEQRSFSRVKFPKMGLELDYNFNNETIDNICLMYTNNEVKAIERDMPIIEWYSKKNKDSLNNVAIIWRDHFLEENIGLLNGFVKMGVRPENILALDKGDSTKHRLNISETFKKLGFTVGILDNTDIDNDVLMKDYSKVVYDFIEKRKDLKVVVLDDGAIVTKILDHKHYDNVAGIIELTEMGLRRIRPNQDNLLYPVLNVAKTKLKRWITYTEISSTIFTRIIELLQAEKLVGRSVLLCGYGDMGEILAERLRSYGVRVTIVDPDVLRLIVASERGFNAYKDCLKAVKHEKPFLIIGASGYKSINKDVIDNLPKYGYVTAGATKDLYAFKEYEQAGCDYQKVEKYGTHYYINKKYIDVLGNGRSVNLFDSEAIPNMCNDIFKASQLVTVNNLINKTEEIENKLLVDIVDEWIEQSNIYDKYYSLYMER